MWFCKLDWFWGPLRTMRARMTRGLGVVSRQFAICETRRLVAIGLSSRSVERCRCDLPRRSGRDSTHSDLLARSQGVARWNFRRISEGTKEVPRNPEETTGLGGLFPSRLISSWMFPALLCCRGLLQDGRTRGYKRNSYACSHSAEENCQIEVGVQWQCSWYCFCSWFALAFFSVLFDPVSAYIYVLYNTHTYIDKYMYVYMCTVYIYIYDMLQNLETSRPVPALQECQADSQPLSLS